MSTSVRDLVRMPQCFCKTLLTLWVHWDPYVAIILKGGSLPIVLRVPCFFVSRLLLYFVHALLRAINDFIGVAHIPKSSGHLYHFIVEVVIPGAIPT